MNTREDYKNKQEFLNCEMEFECPKNWFELESTTNSRVKHCNICNKRVYLCITQEELYESTREARCVAFFKALKIEDENKLIHMTTGLPSLNIGKKLKTFLEE